MDSSENKEYIYIYFVSYLLPIIYISFMMCLCLQCGGWMFLNNWTPIKMGRIDILFNKCMSTSWSKKTKTLKTAYYLIPVFGLLAGIVVACVCPCECPCVKSELVRAITHRFKLGPPNSDQRCKTSWRWLLFYDDCPLHSRSISA